jgi:AcrR family transcriptional regulator
VTTAPNLRARVRAELTAEIKAAARRQLATEGANLSLRAIARELDMVSSAVYRYFPSRDDLLTALIVDAYRTLGDTVDRADAAQPRTDLLGRYLAICHAVRDWARANPHEYALLYGSPVPGYRAPEDTVDDAIRPGRALGQIVHDGVAAGTVTAPRGDRLPKAVRADLTAMRQGGFPAMPEPLLARGMAAWIALFGALSFEVFGHLNGVVHDRDAFFDHQMRAMAHYVGLP